MDLARLAGEQLESASPDLLRAKLKTFAEALMGAGADAICGARIAAQVRVINPPSRTTDRCADRVLMFASRERAGPVRQHIYVRGRDVLMVVAVIVLTLAWLVAAWMIFRTYGSA